MKVHSIVHVCLLSSVLMVSFGCVGKGVKAVGPQVLNANVYTDSVLARPPIYWLDEHRVAIQGYLKAEDIGKDDQRRFLVFDMNSRSVEDRGVIGGGLCVDQGYIRYGRYFKNGPMPGESRWIGGRIGQERVIEKAPPPRPEGKLFDADWECNFEQELPPLPAGMAEFENGRRRLLRLRPEHGFLQYALVPKSDDAVRLIPPVRWPREVVSLPNCAVKPLVPPSIFPSSRPTGFSRPILRCRPRSARKCAVGGSFRFPNGTAEVVHRAVRRSDAEPNATVPEIPTRAGYYFIKPRNFRDNRIGQAGLYRYSETGRHERTVRAEVGGWSVSPDGCRLALGLDRREIKTTADAFVLNVIDLCQGAKQ